MYTTTQLIFATLALLCTSCAAFSSMRVSTRHYVPSTSLMSRYHHNTHHCLRMLNHNSQYVKYNDDSDSILVEQSPPQHDNISPVHHIRQNTDIDISSSNTYHQYYISDHHSITNRVCNILFSILVSFATAISLGVGVSYALDNDIETNGNIQSKFDSMSSVLIAEDQEGQDLYVQLGPKVVLSEEERTIRKIVQSTQQQSEPTVILTNQKDRRSSSYKPKQSPELKVILDDDSPSSLKSSTSSPTASPTELKVELEKRTPVSEQSSTQSTPSQTNERPLNMIEMSGSKKAEVVTIRPQTIEYIKTYKEKETAKAEQAKNEQKQNVIVKSATNDDDKKTNPKSKSATISEVFNNVKLFSLGIGVGTVAIMTYQKLNEIDTESDEYSNESDIPQQSYQGGMSGGSYLDSLNTASSSPEATLNRELSSLDKELMSLDEELTSLDMYLRDSDITSDGGGEGNQDVAFDGVSCKAFKLDKLSMGEQARRIAEFEARQNNGDI